MVAYVIWVISVRVLHLFHYNSDKLQLIYLLLVNAIQLVNTKLLLLLVNFYNSTTLQLSLHCTVQSLKYAPLTSIICWQFPEPDWVPVTFSGAPPSWRCREGAKWHTRGGRSLLQKLEVCWKAGPTMGSHC